MSANAQEAKFWNDLLDCDNFNAGYQALLAKDVLMPGKVFDPSWSAAEAFKSWKLFFPGKVARKDFMQGWREAKL